jgi:hypothetical protein
MTTIVGWLYADLDGLAGRHALAYVVSSAALVGVGRLADRKARTLEGGFHRWSFFGSLFVELYLLLFAVAGMYFGSSAGGFLFIGAGFFPIIGLPFFLGALGIEMGDGGSYSSSGYSSSSSSSSSSSYSSSSSSSSSSSYSGGGGSFGGGGATSSW